MGMIASALRALFGGGGAGVAALGQGVGQVARVFRPDATRALELGHDAYLAAHASHGAEFTHARAGQFDAFVNGLNRLPRPLLALGTLGLFCYAMIDPEGFARRMRGLAEVPEPLWWLLGAVVAFYFGAREAHHLRAFQPRGGRHGTGAPAPVDGAPSAPANPALQDWAARRAPRSSRGPVPPPER